MMNITTDVIVIIYHECITMYITHDCIIISYCIAKLFSVCY